MSKYELHSNALYVLIFAIIIFLLLMTSLSIIADVTEPEMSKNILWQGTLLTAIFNIFILIIILLIGVKYVEKNNENNYNKNIDGLEKNNENNYKKNIDSLEKNNL